MPSDTGLSKRGWQVGLTLDRRDAISSTLTGQTMNTNMANLVVR